MVLSVELRSSDYARAVGVKYEEECRFFVLITRRVLLTRVPVRVRLSRVAPASFFSFQIAAHAAGSRSSPLIFGLNTLSFDFVSLYISFNFPHFPHELLSLIICSNDG